MATIHGEKEERVFDLALAYIQRYNAAMILHRRYYRWSIGLYISEPALLICAIVFMILRMNSVIGEIACVILLSIIGACLVGAVVGCRICDIRAKRYFQTAVSCESRARVMLDDPDSYMRLNIEREFYETEDPDDGSDMPAEIVEAELPGRDCREC